MYQLLINSVDKTDIVAARSLRYYGQADNRQNLNVAINTKANTYMPRIGQVIQLYSSASGTLIFGGVIKTLNKSKLEPMQNSGAYVQVEISSDGYNSIPARRTVSLNFTTNYTGNYMSALRSLVLNDSTYNENIGLGSITAGITIESEYYSVECQSLKEIFDDLATISGCKWYIDNSKNLNFVSEDTVTTANHTISATSTSSNLVHDITVMESLENYCNKVFVAGDIGDDGNLMYVTAILTSEVTARASAEGTANSSGIYGFVIRDTNIDSLTAASTIADNHLKKYGFEPQEISFYSYETDWVAGTQVLVNLPEFGMTAAVTCLIEEVTITSEDPMTLKSYVRCVKKDSGNFSTQKSARAVEWFETLLSKTNTKGGSSVGVTAVPSSGSGAIAHYEATTTATATITTSETTVVSKAFTLSRAADIHMTFSAYMNTTSALTVTGKTYIQGTATSTTAKTYQPQQNLSGNHTFAYNEYFSSVSAGTTTITVKMLTNTATATINAGMCAMNLLIFPTALTPTTTAYTSGDGYVFGGNNAGPTYLQDCDSYNPGSNSWTNKTDIPSPVRHQAAANTISSTAIVYCGRRSTGVFTYLSDCDAINAGSWTSKTDAPSPARAGLAASTISTKGYIYGGYAGSSYYADTDEYTLSGDSWANKTDMVAPTHAFLAASTISTKGYTYGGSCSSGVTATAACKEYNPSSDAWTEKTSIPAISSHIYELAASTISSKGYVYGGYNNDIFNTDNECYEYNASGDSWTTKSNMPSPARDALAASTISDKGYIYAGYGSTYLSDCDEYNPDTWTSKANMPSPSRIYPAASTI